MFIKLTGITHLKPQAFYQMGLEVANRFSCHGIGKHTEKTQYKTHLDYTNRNYSAKQTKMGEKACSADRGK